MGIGSARFQAEMGERHLRLVREVIEGETNAEFVLRNVLGEVDREELESEELVEAYDDIRARVMAE